MDLIGRSLPELKEIAKTFFINAENPTKDKIVLMIIDTRDSNPGPSLVVPDKFSKKKEIKIWQKKKTKGINDQERLS